MSGTALVLNVRGWEPWQHLGARLGRFLDDLASGPAREQLLEVLGAEVESQTRRRLAEEKTGPDGKAWPAWSDAYAATRHGGHSLLEDEGHLRDSIQFLVHPDEVEIGTNLVYGAIHQWGGAGVGKPGLPERPYLGVSDENAADLEAVLSRFVSGALERLQ